MFHNTYILVSEGAYHVHDSFPFVTTLAKFLEYFLLLNVHCSKTIGARIKGFLSTFTVSPYSLLHCLAPNRRIFQRPDVEVDFFHMVNVTDDS